jgi:hypothetical protein
MSSQAFDIGAADGVKLAAESRGSKFRRAAGPEALMGVAGGIGAGIGSAYFDKPVEGAALASGLAALGSMAHGALKKKRRR